MAAAKKITTVAISPEQLPAIEAQRKGLEAQTGIKPSFGAVVRATIDRGLSADRKAG